MTIRVLLVADPPCVRASIRGALNPAPEIEVVAEASNGEEAWRLIQELAPDVALLDCGLRGELDGTAVAKRVQANGHATRVLALSAYDDERYVYGML